MPESKEPEAASDWDTDEKHFHDYLICETSATSAVFRNCHPERSAREHRELSAQPRDLGFAFAK